MTGVDILVEVVGDGVPIFGIAKEASSVVWSNLPLPQLCLLKVSRYLRVPSNV